MVDVLGSCKQGLFIDDKCGNNLLSNLDSKSSRAALLRARFSDTIMKAEVWCQLKDETNESIRIQKEKKLMEKMRLEQQAKNRAAAETASRKNREAKLQRQRDRAAARRALEEALDESTLPASSCFIKKFRGKTIALGSYNNVAAPMEHTYSVIVEEIFDKDAELYDEEGTLGDVMIGQVINWPKPSVKPYWQ